mmetsp:Transcript_10612/g.12076  ORF Transcript_10612/g.12076 Transcript_10612/m.12076 type:complete len:249 (-) Transcript_10612:15-761(-)
MVAHRPHMQTNPVRESPADVVVPLVKPLVQLLVLILLGSPRNVPHEEGHAPSGVVPKSEAGHRHEDNGPIEKVVRQVPDEMLKPGSRQSLWHPRQEPNAETRHHGSKHDDADGLVVVHHLLPQPQRVRGGFLFVFGNLLSDQDQTHASDHACGADPMHPARSCTPSFSVRLGFCGNFFCFRFGFWGNSFGSLFGYFFARTCPTQECREKVRSRSRLSQVVSRPQKAVRTDRLARHAARRMKRKAGQHL